MFENRSLRADISLVVIVALFLFLAVSLLSYHPADETLALVPPLDNWYQPNTLVFPANAETQNACGSIGATIADLLFSTFGYAAFYVLAGLASMCIAIVRGQTRLSPVVRSIGWGLSLIGIASLASIIMPNLTPGPVTGSGGYIGLLSTGMMRAHFALFGSSLLSISIFLTGIMLWTDYAAFRAVQWVLSSLFGVAILGYSARKTRANSEPDRNSLDFEDDDLEETNAGPIRIRMGGKTSIDDLADFPETFGDSADAEADEFDAESDEREDQSQEQLSDSDDEEVADHEDFEEEEDEDYEGLDSKQTLPMVIKTAAKNALFGKRKSASSHEEEEVDWDGDDEEEETEDIESPATDAGLSGPHFKVKQSKPQSEREQIMSTLDNAANLDDETSYDLPGIDLLLPSDDVDFEIQRREALKKAKILESTFQEFGFNVKVTEIETGPVIAQYEISLEAGLRLSKITGLADDLAIALRVPSVRIVAPIPGKNTVGIEVPNETRQVVRLREVMEQAQEKTRRMKIPIYLGKDVVGDPMIADLAALPHLLIAGRTGTGKSVCLNSIISSMLMTRRPDEVRMLMIDPKMVELSGYGRLPHLMHPVVTDMRKAEAILEWAVNKMEERYRLLAKAGVRHVTSFNQLGEDEIYKRLGAETEEEQLNIPVNLPFIVIIADEMADLMMTAGKEVEQHIIRLAQKSRAVGIHLILATQKPTVDVITGLIKSNLPARIAFQVASRTDSRVVLDANGADKLLGNGDMLFLWPGTSTLLRGQGTYLGDDEIQKITDACSLHEQNFVNELVNIKIEPKEGEGKAAEIKNRDELYEQAIETIISENRGSVSLLQRMLGIGYGRAARLIDFMEEDGIVGPYQGSKSREILMTMSQWEATKNGGAAAEQDSVDQPESTPNLSRLSPEERKKPIRKTAIKLAEPRNPGSFDEATENEVKSEAQAALEEILESANDEEVEELEDELRSEDMIESVDDVEDLYSETASEDEVYEEDEDYEEEEDEEEEDYEEEEDDHAQGFDSRIEGEDVAVVEDGEVGNADGNQSVEAQDGGLMVVTADSDEEDDIQLDDNDETESDEEAEDDEYDYEYEYEYVEVDDETESDNSAE